MAEDSDLTGTLVAQSALLSELVSEFLEPRFAKAGLDMGLFELLSSIHAAGPDASQAQVAKRLGITPPSFTEAIQSAASRGFVRQEPHASDKRVKRVVLTSKGGQALRAALKAVNLAEQTVVEQVRTEDLNVALNVLHTAIRNLARATAKPPLH